MDFERFVAKVLDRFSVENLRILKVINIRDEDFEGLRMIDLDGEEKRVVRLGPGNITSIRYRLIIFLEISSIFLIT